jgi:phage tail sheath gpL-like
MSDISFDTIPSEIYSGGQFVEFSNVLANQGLPGQPHRILIVGQMLAAGAGQPLTVYNLTQASDATRLFGQGSMLDRMAQFMFQAQNGYVPIDAIAVADNPAGNAAVGSITFTAAPTAAGTYAPYIGMQSAAIAVIGAETPAQLATALVAEINSLPDMPVIASVDGAAPAKVDLTCKWKGLTGNDIDIRQNYYVGSDQMPAGMTTTIVPMAGGTANPLIAPVIAAIGEKWYTTFVMPWTDTANMEALVTELTSRWGGVRQIDGMSVSAMRGSQGALAAYGPTVNSLDVIVVENTGPSCTYERAASVAGVMAYSRALDPARQYDTLTLPGIGAPAQGEGFNWEERNALLPDGISTTKSHAGVVSIDRLVTTYQTNAAGASDRSYFAAETVTNLSYLRYSTRNMISTTFPRFKLAPDGTPVAQGQDIALPKTVAAAMVALATQWQTAGLVTSLDAYQAALLCIINPSDQNRIDAVESPSLIGNFRTFADQIQFQL